MEPRSQAEAAKLRQWDDELRVICGNHEEVRHADWAKWAWEGDLDLDAAVQELRAAGVVIDAAILDRELEKFTDEMGKIFGSNMTGVVFTDAVEG